jgi:hypothetical protein
MRLGILRSHQLAPGVGGLAAKEMLELRQSVAQTGGAWLMGTACRCHGVVQAWSFSLPAASGKDAP